MATARAAGTVFISHSQQDVELARDIARRLRAAGLQPSSLFESPVADEVKRILRKKIRGADAVIVLVTPTSLKSPWLMTELGMAEGFERLIVPVTVGLSPDKMPLPLQSYQVVPFDQMDEAIQSLAEKLCAVAKH